MFSSVLCSISYYYILMIFIPIYSLITYRVAKDIISDADWHIFHKFLYWFYMHYDNSISFIILQILQSNQSYMLFESNFLE